MSYNDPPWHPITDPIDLKHLGKLNEEAGEMIAATSRVIIQGLYGQEPNTKKVNRVWLEEEIADVVANIELVVDHFKLDVQAIRERSNSKKAKLAEWHKGA